jgi:hypothetical protein
MVAWLLNLVGIFVIDPEHAHFIGIWQMNTQT